MVKKAQVIARLYVFARELMTSVNHVMTPTRGNWFQTNSLEHESDNYANLLCVLTMVQIIIANSHKSHIGQKKNVSHQNIQENASILF